MDLSKLTEISKAAKDVAEKYKKVSKADFGDGCPEEIIVIVSDMGSMIQSLAWQLSYLSDAFSQHMQGHLPPINSTEQMQRAVDALGLDTEYDVQKRVVYAGKGRFLIG